MSEADVWVASQTSIDTNASIDTTVVGDKLEFPPEMTEWTRVNTSSGGTNDCLVHALLTLLSPTYRKQSIAVKDTLASDFRRKGPFSQTKGLTEEEKMRIEGTGFLESSELEAYAKENKLNFLTIARVETPVRQDRAAIIVGNTGGPVYPLYNYDMTHFEAVRGPTGEYSLPFAEAETIAKNFHPDTTPSPPPVSDDDFGYIRITEDVTPPDVIVHGFALHRDGDTLNPTMVLTGSEPATPKIETLRMVSRERRRAEKVVLKRSDGTNVVAGTPVIGTYKNEMEIPLFHFASDVEQFLDNPKVISTTSILPPKSPLLTPRSVTEDKAISFALKSPIDGLTFSSDTGMFNDFFVGPVGDKDHRVALHGFLKDPVTLTIKGRGPVVLQKGFEMVSILTGRLGDSKTKTETKEITPPLSPLILPEAAIESTKTVTPTPTRGRRPLPEAMTRNRKTVPAPEQPPVRTSSLTRSTGSRTLVPGQSIPTGRSSSLTRSTGSRTLVPGQSIPTGRSSSLTRSTGSRTLVPGQPPISPAAAAIERARAREKSPGRIPAYTPSVTAEQAAALGRRGSLGEPIQEPPALRTGQQIPAYTPSVTSEQAAALGTRGSLGTPITVTAPAGEISELGREEIPSHALPPGWKQAADENGDMYYFKKEGEGATYERPTRAAHEDEVPAAAAQDKEGRVRGIIDDTFVDAIHNHIIAFINSARNGLLNDENTKQALKDGKLDSYLASVLKDHRGQEFILQTPSNKFIKAEAPRGHTNTNPGGGTYEIPNDDRLGGDRIRVSVDGHAWGNTIILKQGGASSIKGPTFRFDFEIDYPTTKVGSSRPRKRTLKRARVRASQGAK